MKAGKPRILKSFEKLDKEIREQIKLAYPDGFVNNLITFSKPDGSLVSALPFETDDVYYMVKMTESEATTIVDNDDDFDSDGFLKEDVKDAFSQKYTDGDVELPIMETEEGDDDDDSYGDDPVDGDDEEGDDEDDEV